MRSKLVVPFMLVAPTFSFFLSPLMASLSRKHEFEADAYACRQASGADLARALLKKTEGDEVRVILPKGEMEYYVVAVQYTPFEK